jgi:hypothetical protein
VSSPAAREGDDEQPTLPPRCERDEHHDESQDIKMGGLSLLKGSVVGGGRVLILYSFVFPLGRRALTVTAMTVKRSRNGHR